jgi:hypothetical protein
MGGQAGWRCDACRRQGLEEARRCGWIGEERRGARRVVWVRGRAAAEECPTSLVTPQSVELVEKFLAWKAGSPGDLLKRNAREAEVFLLLEGEWREWGEKSEQSNR